MASLVLEREKEFEIWCQIILNQTFEFCDRVYDQHATLFFQELNEMIYCVILLNKIRLSDVFST